MTRRNDLTETKLLTISLIEREPAIESRIEPIDRRIVQGIAWTIRNELIPPPIIVYRINGKTGRRFVLVDGRNRLAAAKSTGATEIMAEVRVGTLADAIWDAAGVNGRPQQSRTLAEVRRSVELAIGANPKANGKRIAEHCSCSQGIVSEVRRALEAREATPASQPAPGGGTMRV